MLCVLFLSLRLKFANNSEYWQRWICDVFISTSSVSCFKICMAFDLQNFQTPRFEELITESTFNNYLKKFSADFLLLFYILLLHHTIQYLTTSYNTYMDACIPLLYIATCKMLVLNFWPTPFNLSRSCSYQNGPRKNPPLHYFFIIIFYFQAHIN